MAERPTGTVAFLFTDLEGSTSLWERAPDAMRDALALHDQILRAAIGAAGGYVFTTAGDSFAAAFDTADDALSAAVRIQLDIGAADFPDETPLKVRVGVHVGVADERDGDYFGRAPTLAARVMSAAHGGQILVSSTAATQVNSFGLLELGAVTLSGIEQPQAVFQVVAPGLGEEFDPPRGSAAASILPEVSGGLIGRDEHVGRLIDDLEAGARLITLTGPGGVGKTRLALEIGHRVSEWQPVIFVDLTPLADASQIVSTLADLLGLRGEDDRGLSERVMEELGRSARLVILDNCEHVIDDVVDVVDILLTGAGACTVLATSREVLDLPGEQVRRVAPLESGLAAPALDLFSELLVRAGVDIADLDRTELVELCDRLDGLPLALELAAARCTTLSPTEVLSGLSDRFVLLSRRRRRRGNHHESLEATLDWSWDLLADDEREAMARLGVFASSWTIPTMSAVLGIGAAKATDLLDRLASKSLVSRRTGPTGPRINMLESVRAYSRTRAQELGIHDDACDRHLAWVNQLTTETVEQVQLVGGSDRALARLDAEIDEIRLALDRSATSDPALGLAIAIRLWEWWRARLLLTGEGADRISALLDAAKADTPTRIGALVASADLLRLLHGREPDADRASDQAQRLLAHLDDPELVNRLTLRTLMADFDLDDPTVPDRLEQLAEAALRENTTEDSMALHLKSLWTLGRGAVGDLVALAPRTVAAAAKSGNASAQAHGHEVTALTATYSRDLEGARPHLLEAIDGLEASGQLGCVLHAVESIAWWALRGPEPEAGEHLLASVLGLRRTLGRNRTTFEEATIERILDDIEELPEPNLGAELDETIRTARSLVTGDRQRASS